ncbi:MAG: hypothetical protein WDZ76_04235 [Pseudohongiellaceae bacterium]
MKEQHWDDIGDSSREYFDSVAVLQDVEPDPLGKRLQKQRLTELRRRTEERLDWKRIAGDYEFDDLDQQEFSEDYQDPAFYDDDF